MAHGRESTLALGPKTGRNQQVLDRRPQASPVVVLASLEATRYRDNRRRASGREQSSPRRSSSGAWTPPRSFSPTSCAHRTSLTANGGNVSARSGPNAPRQGSPSPARHDARRHGLFRRAPRPATRTRRPSRAPPAGDRRVPPARRRQAEQAQRHPPAASHHAACAYETFTRLHASPEQRLARGPAHEPVGHARFQRKRARVGRYGGRPPFVVAVAQTTQVSGALRRSPTGRFRRRSNESQGPLDCREEAVCGAAQQVPRRTIGDSPTAPPLCNASGKRSSAPVHRPHPSAALSCMERDSGSGTAFHEGRSAVRADCAPADAGDRRRPDLRRRRPAHQLTSCCPPSMS
jgi:hypothetical protein